MNVRDPIYDGTAMSAGEVRPRPPIWRGSEACLHAWSVSGQPSIFSRALKRPLVNVLKEKEPGDVVRKR